MNGAKLTKEQIIERAAELLGKTLRDLVPADNINRIVDEIDKHGTNRKGFWGDLIEEHGFGIQNNNLASADFDEAGIELKSTPIIKGKSGKLRAKERLAFSMINYMTVVDETWLTSSFLKKNQRLLVLFYLYEQSFNLLDYQILNYKFLDLLSDLSEADVVQIVDDWNHIVEKIKRGEAHLLSEGDTAYLGAATKSAGKHVRRQQPFSDTPAKPRAFSLKQSYLNTIVSEMMGPDSSESLFKKDTPPQTIQSLFGSKFNRLIGLTEEELARVLDVPITEPKPKNFRRLLVNNALGVRSNKIKELIKANITLKVIKLEESGTLKESISFPVFKYMDIKDQEWEESDFYKNLTERRFIFVVFRSSGNTSKLDSFKFWSFPMKDIEEAERVWRLTVANINDGKADCLPKISESSVAHVRPHARDSSDTFPTPSNGEQVKKCFWLNAKYIESSLK